ncbi:hypothetical protein J6590_065790 [Homalodisca vitripennis]|nr:hypothetical protein J6590_065790 [Homalodisca vitripennis]
MNRKEDKSGSNLKIEKKTLEEKIETHKGKLKGKCEIKTETVVRQNVKVNKKEHLKIGLEQLWLSCHDMFVA